jgi:hypothetical protein
VKQKDYQKLIEQVRALPAETILAAAYRCDGHTIFKPQAFIDAGLPQAVVDHCTTTHSSDGSPKGTIFVDGQPVKELSGVYGLDLLRFLANALDLEYAAALGRGFEARNIHAALRRHFQAGVQTPD